MEIVLAALVAAGVAVAVVMLVQRPRAVGAAVSAQPRMAERANIAQATATQVPTEAAAVPVARDGLEEELLARRTEIARLEERLRAKESSLQVQEQQLGGRERALDDRSRNLDNVREELKTEKARQLRELERVSGLSAGQAKQILMHELEDDLRHDSARVIRQVEEETRRDADRRSRSILAAVMQRVASSHAVETTVSVVELKSDELKGRIIGREGRNIRALETLTGIDFIIDDTPGAVLLSGFDGVRREIARLTLEKLLQDGRIHPARIEEAFHQAKSEIDQHVVEVGEQAVFEANVGSLHPELVKLLGRLRFRTSYGQNVLHHSIECARLASMLAAELGADPRCARTRWWAASWRGATRSPRRSRTPWRPTTTRSSRRPSRP
jgi:ribonuclease Y